MQPRNFKDLNIKINTRNSIKGDKIKIYSVLNRKITLVKYKISDSKYEGDYLRIEIVFEGKTYMLQTGSKNLIHVIKQIPQEMFPIDTTIIEIEKTYNFT